jgi:NADPH:quinone reductase
VRRSTPERVRAWGARPLPYGPSLPALIQDATDGRGVDLVFDSVGRDTQAASWGALARYGHLIYLGEASGPPTPIAVDDLYSRCLRVSAFWLGADPPGAWHDARETLQAWVADGTIQVTLDRTYPLEHASDAHRPESRGTIGKLILLPAP